ncbi:MAG: DUF6798 domain-containing protein [Cyanobacteria bacterium J06635_1]
MTLRNHHWYPRLNQVENPHHYTAIASFVLPVLIVTGFLSLGFVLGHNMGNSNEIHHLPLARQAFDPSWVPGDIYYSEDPGYRLLFQMLFGPMTTSMGFLATSIVGRLISYACLSIGLWCLSQQLRLSLLGLLMALCLFIYPNTNASQGVIAGEWLIGGLEPKVFAYSLVLMALSFALSKRYFWMVACLGLSASFHVLVGGWSTVIVGLWLLFRRQAVFTNMQQWGIAALLYGLSSIFALRAVLKQLTTPVLENNVLTSTLTEQFSPAYLYVFLRNPHHVNPLSWEAFEWSIAGLYLVIFIGVVIWLRQADREPISDSQSVQSQLAFAGFVGASLIPFAMGVLIAPLDLQGQVLQYYPFRVGDLMLPLGTCLLLVARLETIFHAQRRPLFAVSCLVVLGVATSFSISDFHEAATELIHFPSKPQQVSSDWKEMCAWIRQKTPSHSLIVSQPYGQESLYWLAERPTIAKFLFIPSASSAEVEIWYERLVDLSGGLDIVSHVDRYHDKKKQIRQALNKAFFGLKTSDAIALLDKYQASYFLTQTGHHLDLPIAHHNNSYILYGT